jgi:hypothetical protein
VYNAVLPDPFDFLQAVIKNFTYFCFIYVNCQQFSLSIAQNAIMIIDSVYFIIISLRHVSVVVHSTIIKVEDKST